MNSAYPPYAIIETPGMARLRQEAGQPGCSVLAPQDRIEVLAYVYALEQAARTAGVELVHYPTGMEAQPDARAR